MRAICSRSCVTDKASDNRMRAFWGIKLSAIRKPALASLVPGTSAAAGARALHYNTPRASFSASKSPGGAIPGAKPAETIPLAPAAVKARTAVPSPPA